MSKRILMIVLLTAILSACGSKPSWDQEKVPAASAGQVQRLMADQVKADLEPDRCGSLRSGHRQAHSARGEEERRVPCRSFSGQP